MSESIHPSILREVRKRLGVTQKEFAKKIDVAESTLIRWEKGGGDYPTVKALLKILELDPRINPAWLLTGSTITESKGLGALITHNHQYITQLLQNQIINYSERILHLIDQTELVEAIKNETENT